MNPDYYNMAIDLLNSGIGDEGRLRFILDCINNNKPLYKTDIKFLEQSSAKLESKIEKLNTKKTPPTTSPKTNSQRVLISDEFLDKHIEKIIDKDNTKKIIDIPIKKKSFFARIFSR